MTIEFAQFVREKEAEMRRDIPVDEISKGSGVSGDTIRRLLKGKVNRIDMGTVNGLCKFFNVPTGAVPFIVYNGGQD